MQHTLGGFHLQREIMNRGYAEFEHNISNDQIELAVDRYTHFTLNHPDPEASTMNAMLPEGAAEVEVAYKLDDLDRSQDTQDEWHKYRTNHPQIGKPDGYTNRTFQAKALFIARGLKIEEDPKEYYHYTPSSLLTMDEAHKRFGWGQIPQEVYLLHKALHPIHAKASQLILSICRTIEEFHPEIRRYVDGVSLKNSPLRLLFYHPSNTERLAGGHYDKSLMTLQIAESHQGLRIARNSDTPLEPVMRDASKAVFFPSASLPKHIPELQFLPGWHDVVGSSENNAGRQVPAKALEVCARYAIIFFVNGINLEQLDKKIMHQR